MDATAQGKESGESRPTSSARKPFPTTIEGKLLIATEYKEAGNVFFKENDFKKAVSSYAKVLAFVRGLPGSKRGLEGVGQLAADYTTAVTVTPEQDQQAAELECVVMTNMATCYLKQKNPRKAVEYVDKTLAINPTSWKAMLRKAEAHVQMSNFDHAKTILAEALSIAPDAQARVAIAKGREALLISEKAANNKQKDLFKKANIFGIKEPALAPEGAALASGMAVSSPAPSVTTTTGVASPVMPTGNIPSSHHPPSSSGHAPSSSSGSSSSGSSSSGRHSGTYCGSSSSGAVSHSSSSSSSSNGRRGSGVATDSSS